MEGDQGGHVVGHAGGEAQLAEPGPGHRGTHHLMVVERHPAVRQQAAGLRLADVVQQRGQPEPQIGLQPVPGFQGDGLVQHGQRVLVDVLVPEMLVDLEPEPGNLGQHLIGHPGVHQQFDPAHRAVARCEHELGELVRDPFGRYHRQPRSQRRDRVAHLGGHREAELRGETGGAQHPQRVVGERVLRLPRRAQHLVPQVGKPAERVGQLQRWQPRGHCVDGEVTPGQVFGQRGPILHVRLARVGQVALAAVGGDLTDGAALAQPHGAEVDPGLPHRVRPALGDREHLLGPGVRGQVEVAGARPRKTSRTEPPTRASSWPRRANSRTSPATGAAVSRSRAAAARRCSGVRSWESGTGIEGRAWRCPLAGKPVGPSAPAEGWPQ